jgi:DNA-binding phage protein
VKIAALKTPEARAELLSAALSEDRYTPHNFAAALRDVARASGSSIKIGKRPRWLTVRAVFDEAGLELGIQAKRRA